VTNYVTFSVIDQKMYSYSRLCPIMPFMDCAVMHKIPCG